MFWTWRWLVGHVFVLTLIGGWRFGSDSNWWLMFSSWLWLVGNDCPDQQLPGWTWEDEPGRPPHSLLRCAVHPQGASRRRSENTFSTHYSVHPQGASRQSLKLGVAVFYRVIVPTKNVSSHLVQYSTIVAQNPGANEPILGYRGEQMKKAESYLWGRFGFSTIRNSPFATLSRLTFL